ncbi:hypothetical protein L6Q21_06650 [Sandaracinobacter sp. RS1-74]|uniref:hypothetical protein n=1 Tax=Sandaracinobacteroides sayramensis TaxID=2913411 RepID=UPI001EDA927E|nr:hypothetical protein [Sandaracinobacteroides sayramensis]MCG2840653.1 hypothetical protein [Sandaracinobacteroides sayramensis]
MDRGAGIPAGWGTEFPCDDGERRGDGCAIVVVALFGYRRRRITMIAVMRWRNALLDLAVIRGVVPAGFQPFS